MPTATVPKVFDLHISTNVSAMTVELCLADAAGIRLAWRELRLKEHPESRWEGLFDLGAYIQRYAGILHPLGKGEPLDGGELVRELGVFLGREVLGAWDSAPSRNLFGRLVRGLPQRTLRIRLPASEQYTDDLTAAFARVPWEIARAGATEPTLAEKNVVVCALAGEKDVAPEPLSLKPGEPLRVLLVLAEGPDSPPIAAQLERRQLLQLFHARIYPRQRVEVDVLSHGVTRERLAALIRNRGGFHVLHWSGHGFRNLLEVYSVEDEVNLIAGQELVRFFEEAGGYPPRLVFLGTCYSANFLHVRDWEDFEAIVEGRIPVSNKRVGDVSAHRTERSGYNRTAHALLEAGIPTVVAMRYDVDANYARDFATEFYAYFFADKTSGAAGAALNYARRALLAAAQRGEAHGYSASDHAAPMLYGSSHSGLLAPSGSTPLPTLQPPLRIAELHPHRDFIGRTWDLAQLGAHWLGADGKRPIAVVRGLGGLGKTALAAEAISLWHMQFRWVFAFQAKPVALGFDDFLRQLHVAWVEQEGEYTATVAKYPAEALWRPTSEEFTEKRREQVLGQNLIAALRAEAVLLVLDNFDTCLVPRAAAQDKGHASQDPAWDALLTSLSIDLIGTDSRVLITSRLALAALVTSTSTEHVSLGPFRPGEAALYVREHPGLSRLFFKPGGRSLVKRLIEVSRGHPLLINSLARLAERDTEALRVDLGHLAQEGSTWVTAFFADDPLNLATRKYLEDALVGSIDLLLERAGPEARRALWVLSLAETPIFAPLWREVWHGRDFEEEQLLQLRDLLSKPDALPPELRRQLEDLPEEMRAKLAAVDSEDVRAAESSTFEELRRSLIESSLVTENLATGSNQAPMYTCHELVRERVLAWIGKHPEETSGRAKEQVWAAYGDRLVFTFRGLLASGELTTALEAGAQALRYVVRAGEYERLGTFAGELVSSTNDPTILRVLLPALEIAAAGAPSGRARWQARSYLAEALVRAGRPDAGLPHYAAAADEAEQANAWDDLATITGNWAYALRDCGELSAAREKHRKSAQLLEQAGRPELDVVQSQLEALRIQLMIGQIPEVVPEIERRLSRIRAWWQASLHREPLSKGLGIENVGRALISALDIARQAYLSEEQWQKALDRTSEILSVKSSIGVSEHEIARDRFNRYGPLLQLGRLSEAQRELEQSLEIFEQAGDLDSRSKVLSALAHVSSSKGDLLTAVALQRRALALANTSLNPLDRAITHSNLGSYLNGTGHHFDAAAHQLAALLYLLVMGHRQYLQTWVRRHMIEVRTALTAGQEHNLPQAVDLLARPDFTALREWLTAAQADVEQLQVIVDAVVAQGRKAADEILTQTQA